MSSTLTKIGTGLSFFNTAWLTGLTYWFWSSVPVLRKDIAELEEVICEINDDLDRVNRLQKEVDGFSIALDELTNRFDELEEQYKKQSLSESFSYENDSYSPIVDVPRRNIMVQRGRGAHGGRGGRGARGGRGGTRTNMYVDEFDELESCEIP